MSSTAELRLTREERRKVFDGSLHMLRRKIKPYPLAAGQRYVVASTRRIRQIVDKETGEVLHIPPKPNLWITIKGWTLKDGEWEISISITDERQPIRRLAMGAPSGTPRPGGLKTRETTPKPKGDEIKSWTSETERGYGGADGEEAVDDATLTDFAGRAQMRNERSRETRHDEGAVAAAEAKVVDELLVGNIPGARAAQRRVERARRRIADRDEIAA